MLKNIVLLADGTGNSSGSPFKTNVWRLFQAIDIEAPPAGQLPQLTFYNDGVGTGTFRPLVMLGLAFGVGLARNVKELYTYLCRNYEPGDNIYLFGFSRGAFTVRILAGLILRCGLVKADSEDELRIRVKLAYAEYRRDAARRATATRPYMIAGRLLGGSKRGRETDHISFNFPEQHFPRIAFMGVWDTVDAYGMPVDELKTGIDRYVWPMTLADRRLSDHIDRVCHALSLDDERPTFRPVLWTDPTTDPERLSQVWFAGVHADVGGGYPDDSLSYVTLQWMMNEAQRSGLRLYPRDVAACAARVNAHGPQHDSRAGLAGYYRYGPRNVDRLASDRGHDVDIGCVEIHRAAMSRIQEWQVAYAPISFPTREPWSPALPVPPRSYALVDSTGPAGELERMFPVETPGEVIERTRDMRLTELAVIRRRITYFTTLLLTIVLGVLPAFDFFIRSAAAASLRTASPSLYRLFSAPFVVAHQLGRLLSGLPFWFSVTSRVSALLSMVARSGLVPGWTSPWIASFAKHPTVFLICGTTVLWLFVRTSANLQDQIFARAEYSWRRV